MSHDLVDGAALVSYHIEMCFCDKCDCLVRIVSTVTHIKKPVCLSCEEGHALDVARKLHGMAASVKILDFPNLPKGGDVSDWLEGGLIYGLMPTGLAKLALLSLLDIILMVVFILMTIGFVMHRWRKSKQSTTGA